MDCSEIELINIEIWCTIEMAMQNIEIMNLSINNIKLIVINMKK